MKKKLLILLVFIFLHLPVTVFSQITAAGDIAFTAINTDGGDDLAIVTLVDISANTTVYITDKEWDGTSAFTGTQGIKTWDSGALIIKAGTVIIFSDLKSAATTHVSHGTISSSGSFNITNSGETVLVYLGTDQNTPTTFLTGIKNAAVTAGELNNTGLTVGTTFLEFIPTSDPDAGIYTGSRSSETSYTNYSTLLYNLSNWTSNGNSGDGEVYIPFSTSGFTISTTTWTGTTSTDWTVAGNWNNGIPDNSFAVTIPNVANNPVISSGTTYTIGNLTIDASSSLTINAGKGLTVSGNLTNNGTLTLNSDASTSGSLIVTGTATGNIIYNRYMTGVDKWHLISAPVGGQDINTFVTTGSNNVAFQSPNYSLTPYDNTVAKGASGVWNHWTSDGTGAGNISGAGNFTSGKGYEVLRTADGTMAFTGTVAVADVGIAVTSPVSNNAWNLIGNPFPSSIFANSDADATNNFITVNAAAMDASFVGLYLWDPTLATPAYVPINNVPPATYIAPGQAFFVKAIAGGGTVNFITAMRVNQATVAFQKINTSTPSISLKADNGSTTKTTEIKYIAGKSLGLDPGYDAGLFDASGGNFNLYTKLVADNGVKFMLQVVPDSIYNTTVIPVGLEATAGTQIIFKATYSDLPTGKKVYLEDRLLGLYTEINNTNKNYTLTLSADETGVGRFYLHTLDNLATLAIDDFNKSNFKIIANPKSNNLRIIGNITQSTVLNIYDTLGRLVRQFKLNNSTDQTVFIPNLKQGIYIVKGRSKNKQISIKIAWFR